MSQCLFFALSYSPWSEKARWALDHHRVDYREIEHIPVLGSPVLRTRLRCPFGRVTVPALIDGKQVFGNSLDIARHADRIGQGEPLLPTEMVDAINTWNMRSENVLDAGRVLVFQKVPRSPAAMLEAMPPQFPKATRPTLMPIAHVCARFLENKYGTGQRNADIERKRIGKELEALRDFLGGTERYLLGRFTYADVVMAVALQVVEPVANRWLPIGQATRTAWREPDLAETFQDLLAWRDWLYAQHR